MFLVKIKANLSRKIIHNTLLFFFNHNYYFIGGCGAMFEVNVIAPEFKGLTIVKQHQIINEVSIFISGNKQNSMICY